MKFTYLSGLLACTVALIGCVPTPPQGVGIAKGRTGATTTFQHKRINTTECKDSDDWYLDGYRVGKSFSTQKNEMFQQRVNYCRYTASTLPSQFKRQWEKGYAVGNKGAAQSRSKSKKRR